MAEPQFWARQNVKNAFQILLMAVWFGLSAGMLEAAILNALRLRPAWLVWTLLTKNVSLDFLWRAPLVYLILFVSMGAVFAGLSFVTGFRLIPRGVTALSVSFFAFAWMAFYPPIAVFQRLHTISVLVLSAGLAFWTTRLFSRKPQSMDFFRRTFWILVATLVGMAAATTGWNQVRESMAYEGLPPEAAGAPNILLIVLDAVAAKHLSVYGYELDTSPTLLNLGREGVVFDNAIAPSSWTPPSHGTIFTGLLLSEHRADSPRPVLGSQFETLAEAAVAQGYATAGFSANTWWVTRNSGFAQGFLHFEDYFGSFGDVVARTVYGKILQDSILPRFGFRNIVGRKAAKDVNHAALGWLDSHGNRPFFVFLNYFCAHPPYLPPEPFHSRFVNRSRALEKFNSFEPPVAPREKPTKEQVNLWVAAYDGAISHVDSHLGKLFAGLKQRGLLDNTLVIVTSDHGEGFGQHGLFQHGLSLYREVIHVPLLLRLPGKVPAGMHVKRPVSLADIPATVESLAFPSRSKLFPGESLENTWRQDASSTPSQEPNVISEVFSRVGLPRNSPAGQGWVKSITTSKWHLILQENGKLELYEWLEDPDEQHNLAHLPHGREVANRLKERLLEITGH